MRATSSNRVSTSSTLPSLLTMPDSLEASDTNPGGFTPMAGEKVLKYTSWLSVSLAREPGKGTFGIHNGSSICAILTSSSIALVASSKNTDLSMPAFAMAVIAIPAVWLEGLPVNSVTVELATVVAGTEPMRSAGEPGVGGAAT